MISGADTADLLAPSLAAPFPPAALMMRVSGVDDDVTFAAHARDIYAALRAATPKPLHEFKSILDFGCGSGRVARMFEGFSGRYVGADIDREAVEWLGKNLPWVTPAITVPRSPLPFEDAQFDCVISVSVLTHMTEKDSKFYLSELRRVCRPGATLLLTVHGARAADRATTEEFCAHILTIPAAAIETAVATMRAGGFYFARQDFLSSDAYEYGISFTSESYIRDIWAQYFIVESVASGAIYDFQDIVTLTAPASTLWKRCRSYVGRLLSNSQGQSSLSA